MLPRPDVGRHLCSEYSFENVSPVFARLDKTALVCSLAILAGGMRGTVNEHSSDWPELLVHVPGRILEPMWFALMRFRWAKNA